jgi:hypothetical protein
MTDAPFEDRIFDGTGTAELEKWLGDNFDAWVPDQQAVTVKWPDGFTVTAHAGDKLRRLPNGAFEVWPK